jgi:hypothetical protein
LGQDGRRKREEGRRKREEGRGKREEGRTCRRAQAAGHRSQGSEKEQDSGGALRQNTGGQAMEEGSYGSCKKAGFPAVNVAINIWLRSGGKTKNRSGRT